MKTSYSQNSLINNRKIQGVLAIMPVACFILAFISYFAIFFSIFSNFGEATATAKFMGNLLVFFIFVILSAISGLLAFIYYVIHVLKNPELKEQDLRLVWILAIVFGNAVGIFVYWLIQIRLKDPKPVIDLLSDDF